MKLLSVIPHVGIGALKLAMSPEQILIAINEVCADLSIPNNGDMQISEEKEADGFTLRYLGNTFFFMVRYQNNHAVEIAIDHELKEHAKITLYDKDVFETPVEELVTFLTQSSPCLYDLEDVLLSTNYEFPEIGVRLWREQPFHKKLLSDKEYMKEMGLVIDEMYRYLYFELIAVK